MNFLISKDNILFGNRKSCASCPAARAIQDKLPGAAVQADYDFITINERKYVTPAKVTRFMHRFDFCVDKSRLRAVSFSLPVEEYP